jgi:GNAT superfamily N-acetyltransferase
MKGNYNLRPMREKDIPAGMRLKNAAGWNQLEGDWKLFLNSSQDGSLVAEYGDKVIGTVNYSGRFSWIGMVLVDPEIRRMGIGTSLLKEAITRAKDKGTIRLDATPKGKLLYDTLGFEDEYGLCRYEIKAYPSNPIGQSNIACSKISNHDLAKVIAYDQHVFGAPRAGILRSLYDIGTVYAWICGSRDNILGYCFGRPGSNFEQIGPIIALNEEIAFSLLCHAIPQCEGRPIIIDIPDDQKAFVQSVEELGFRIQRPFIRMYLGNHLYPGRPEQQFAIAGPEIG